MKSFRALIPFVCLAAGSFLALHASIGVANAMPPVAIDVNGQPQALHAPGPMQVQDPRAAIMPAATQDARGDAPRELQGLSKRDNDEPQNWFDPPKNPVHHAVTQDADTQEGRSESAEEARGSREHEDDNGRKPSPLPHKNPGFHPKCDHYTRGCEAEADNFGQVSPRAPTPPRHDAAALQQEPKIVIKRQSTMTEGGSNNALGARGEDEHVEVDEQAREHVVDDGKGSADSQAERRGFWAYILSGLYAHQDDNGNRAEVNCPSNNSYRSCVPAKNSPPPEKCDVYTRCKNAGPPSELSTDSAGHGHPLAQLKPVRIIHKKVKAAAHGHAHGHVKYGPVAYHKHLAHVIGNGNDIIHPVGHEKALPHSDGQHQIDNSEGQASQDELAAEVVEAAANEDHPHAEEVDPVEQQQGRLEGWANADGAHA